MVALLASAANKASPDSSSDRLSATVVPFEEVWSRSYCRARETLVDVLSEFPHEAEHIFKPPCVPLWRCAGCCGDESLECIAVETRTIELQVLRVSPILGRTRQEDMKFTEHTRCACRPRRKRLKSERNHPTGAKRRPRHPGSTLPGTATCELPGPGAQEDHQSRLAEVLDPDEAKTVMVQEGRFPLNLERLPGPP
uniref:Platelet-derived growth factor (PDGF) family profile domain-containing protein n=1 Tax=Salvator merianae TaxID=96440 RepID=A0A8D0DWL3_SALMN